MTDRDERVVNALREFVDRAPVDAEVWAETERHAARHRHRRQAMGAALVIALVAAVAIAGVVSSNSNERVHVAATVPTSTSASVDACPGDCVGRATADVDGDGRPDNIGLSATPPLSGDATADKPSQLVLRVVFANGRVAEYDDTAEWDASLIGAADVNGDGRAEIFYFNNTGANLHSGYILRWDGSKLVAVQGPDGKPFNTFARGYALGGAGFRCSGSSFITMTIDDNGPPDGWNATQTTYHWNGNQLVKVASRSADGHHPTTGRTVGRGQRAEGVRPNRRRPLPRDGREELDPGSASAAFPALFLMSITAGQSVDASSNSVQSSGFYVAHGEVAVKRAKASRRSVVFAIVAATALLLAAVPPAAASPAWSITPSPNPAGLITHEYAGPTILLQGVSCPTATSCFAVGYWIAQNGASNTLIEHWDGSNWSIMSSPNGDRSANELFAISCPGANSCFAVGDHDFGGKALIEHWDGTHWSIMTTPAGGHVSLAAVSCPNTKNCFAAGTRNAAVVAKTFIEHWDGTHWSIMTSPNPARGGAYLTAISCPNTKYCFAVGARGSSAQTFVEHWNGARWSIKASANPTGHPSYVTLTGVSCANPSICFAVGYAGNSPFVERWKGNGSRWLISASPTPVPPPLPTSGSEEIANVELLGVSCASAKSCVAVGYSGGSAGSIGAAQSLVEQWNGKRWSIVASPNPTGSVETRLFGVSCPNAADCNAVGGYDTDTGNGPGHNTLAETYA